MKIRVDKEEYDKLVRSSKEMTLDIEEYLYEISRLKKELEEAKVDASDAQSDLEMHRELLLAQIESRAEDLDKLSRIPKIVQKLYGVK